MRRQRIALLVAVVWSTGLLLAGYLAPAYTVETSAGRTTTTETETLVGANGSGVALILLIPLVCSCLAAAGLLLRGLPGGVQLAWVMTGAVSLLTAVGMLTIGIFVAPVAIALWVACAARSAERAAELR